MLRSCFPLWPFIRLFNFIFSNAGWLSRQKRAMCFGPQCTERALWYPWISSECRLGSFFSGAKFTKKKPSTAAITDSSFQYGTLSGRLIIGIFPNLLEFIRIVLQYLQFFFFFEGFVKQNCWNFWYFKYYAFLVTPLNAVIKYPIKWIASEFCLHVILCLFHCYSWSCTQSPVVVIIFNVSQYTFEDSELWSTWMINSF